MKNINLAIIFIILFINRVPSFGQVAVIKDADGYSNVRAERNSNSEIIYKLKTDVVFFYTEDYYKDSKKWVEVYIPKNLYSLDTPNKFITGYIHKSRIVPLDEMNSYNEMDFTFKLTTKPFEKEGKIIDYFDEGQVFSINGIPPMGTDNQIPRSEIDEIKIFWSGQKIDISPALTMDLFNCRDNSKIFRVDNNFIVQLSCSDGAGFFELIWVVDKNGIKQRLIGSIY